MTTMALADEGVLWKPKKAETEQAKHAFDKLDAILRETVARHEGPQVFLKRALDSHISIPPKAIEWMVQILKEVALGNAVTLIPIHAVMTTQQAADFLNVSRPFLISLLEKGDIKFQKVGRHRRIQFGDLLDYKSKYENERLEALARITQRTQALEGDHFDLADLKELKGKKD
ncbi:MAG: excisionase family DNA-binding protein [Deltaproteobacteria bacterium]|nr:excisionase family DNA-binding protein [Deltaproteobacteria bacterium]